MLVPIVGTDVVLGLFPIAVDRAGDPHAGRTKPSTNLKMVALREIQLAILFVLPDPTMGCTGGSRYDHLRCIWADLAAPGYNR